MPEKICGVLDTVVAVGMTKVRFSGGEPLMYPHLEQVIDYAVNLGLYCVQVTPSMTVVPCRLGLHLYRQCNDFTQLGSALSEIIDIYDTSYLAHDFGNKYQGFHDARLIELEGGAAADLSVIPLLGYVANTNGENIRC